MFYIQTFVAFSVRAAFLTCENLLDYRVLSGDEGLFNTGAALMLFEALLLLTALTLLKFEFPCIAQLVFEFVCVCWNALLLYNPGVLLGRGDILLLTGAVFCLIIAVIHKNI